MWCFVPAFFHLAWYFQGLSLFSFCYVMILRDTLTYPVGRRDESEENLLLSHYWLLGTKFFSQKKKKERKPYKQSL